MATARLDASVRRVLEIKRQLGLFTRRTVDLDSIMPIVGSKRFLDAADDLAARSLTLVRDAGGALHALRARRSRLALIAYADEQNGSVGQRIAEALRQTPVPVVAISPLVGGKAVKGPTTKLMAELGIDADNEAIARHYEGVIDGMLHDHSDAPPASLPARAAATLMTSLEDKMRVAEAAIAFARALNA